MQQFWMMYARLLPKKSLAHNGISLWPKVFCEEAVDKKPLNLITMSVKNKSGTIRDWDVVSCANETQFTVFSRVSRLPHPFPKNRAICI